MRKYDGRLVGILGTVIIHLIAGIIFISFQIRSLQQEDPREFEVEIVPVSETGKKENLVELPATTVENIFKGDDEMLNIARNLANKPDEKINAADYIDNVKEELIKSGKLGVDNYIDEQKRLKDLTSEEGPGYEKDSLKNPDKGKSEKSVEMAANYKGPTRIYYNLPGRNHLYLPIPIYKCQGSGKVVLNISVNQKGLVEKAIVISTESTTTDPCLLETAVTTALISRFTSDVNSPKLQTGTLSYHFVAQ